MTQMANYWSGECHHVSILTFESSNTPFYPLSNSVKWHAIDIKSQSSSWTRGLLKNMIRVFRIRKAVLTVKPDCIINGTNCLTGVKHAREVINILSVGNNAM